MLGITANGLNGEGEHQLLYKPKDDGAETFSQHQKASNNELCPNTNMWFMSGENGTCHCGNDLNGLVYCDPDTKELLVLDCHCITSHYTPENTVVAVVGNCIFNCANLSFNNNPDTIYRAAPSNCHYLNRQGTLCGQCLDGYALPAYS